MKKIIFTFILFSISLFACSTNLNGKYLTEDYNTESIDGMIKVTYTFTNDSLYIDTYPSGCCIAAMKLDKVTDNEYVATETLTNIYTDEVIKKFLYHLSFFKCAWDKNSIAVYRDGSVVDIIKKID